MPDCKAWSHSVGKVKLGTTAELENDFYIYTLAKEWALSSVHVELGTRQEETQL